LASNHQLPSEDPDGPKQSLEPSHLEKVGYAQFRPEIRRRQTSTAELRGFSLYSLKVDP
jgi:hypothetical protein